MSTLSGILERLKKAKRVAIFTHQRPDPDALGSQVGIAHLLVKLGAEEVLLVQFGEVPPPYRFLLEDLPQGCEVRMWGSEFAGSAGGVIDTILVVDTCTYGQLEPAMTFLKGERAKVVGLDHHVSREEIGAPECLYADTGAAACVELVWELARMAGIGMEERMATALMAGLVADTGWFRFDSVKPRTHVMAAELVQVVNPAALYERLMQNETKPKVGLMGRALAGCRWSFEDRFACMALTAADFAETGAAQSQTEELVNVPLQVKTVEVVALMTETAEGKVKVSLRAKRGVDVNAIANLFGGGGHKKAAGCRLEGPLEAAYSRVREAVGKAVGE